ncbi:MAG: hypothetical protein ACYS32_05045 [Planctomycetota bacterium]|jgi:hypothetical protein
MDTYESHLSRSSELNEQIAREIFDILPDDAPVVIIIGRDGNRWFSDSAKFSNLDISESFLKEVCAKIDDGTEPVITQMNEIGVVAAQLAMEETHCGYVVMALPQYNIESTMINFGLIEMSLNQIGLIAKLMGENEQADELKMKQLSMYSQFDTASS